MFAKLLQPDIFVSNTFILSRTKPLDHDTAWPFVEPLLFWKGDRLASRSEESDRSAIEMVAFMVKVNASL